MNQCTTTIRARLQYFFTYTNLVYTHIPRCILCVLFCLITACTPHQVLDTSSAKQTHVSQDMPQESSKLLRADPGYVQWLEQQSFLHTAKELIGIVSGTSLAWHQNGNHVNHLPLLEKSSMWLSLSPRNIANPHDLSSPLALLSTPSIIATLQQKGLALYLSDIEESDFLWSYNTSHHTSDCDTSNPLPVSYAIAPQIGTDDELLSLNASLRQLDRNMQNILHPQLLGTDIVSASTGLGPDFFLAARGHKDYIGVYAMVEVPQRYWALLPDIQEDGQCQALEQTHYEALLAEHILPPTFHDAPYRNAQNGTPQNPSSNQKLAENTRQALAQGWAATGIVRGVDGNARRWVYAYAANPMQAILNWNDPSRLAKRIFSGSIIKNTGILGVPLVGLSLNDFEGFEPQQNTGQERAESMVLVQNAEPMITASKALAHEIRAYGGWSWLRQALPTALLPHFMNSAYHASAGPDFFTSQLGSVVKQSFEQGSARLLHNYFDTLLEHTIDGTRLAHTVPIFNLNKQINKELISYTYGQNIALAARFFASQSGLIIYPARAILPLAGALYAGTDKAHVSTSFTMPELQKSILALPNSYAWRERYHVARAKLIARLPSSEASLILLSELSNGHIQNVASAPSEAHFEAGKKRYLVTITNTTEQAAHEQCSLEEYFPQWISAIHEIDMNGMVIPNTDSFMKEEGKDMLDIDVPAKTCRIFIVSSL